MRSFALVLALGLVACSSPPAGLDRISLTSGAGQSDTVGAALAAPFVVTVEDADANPLENITVDFVVVAGGGQVSAASVRTDALGRAETTLTLGTTVGENRVEAQVPGLSGSPVVFTATGRAGPAARIVAGSGDSQTGTAGAPLAAPLVAVVTDAYGNPVAGSSVDFTVMAGAGSISSTSAVSNAAGQAQTVLTLDTVAGTNQVTASSTALSGSPIVFTATGLPGPATLIALVSGDAQTGAAGEALAAPFVVILEDAHGNAVADQALDFVVTGGGGSLSATSVTTDAQGLAQATLTLGSIAGANEVHALAAGLSGSPVVFAATGLAGPAAQLALVSGNDQIGTASAPLAAALVVAVQDVHGNPVAGATVLFVTTVGGGHTSASAPTDGQGHAESTWTLGTIAGANQVEARLTGLSSLPVVFSAIGIAGPAARILLASGSGQHGNAGEVLAAPMVVSVQDAHGNAVPGLTVAFVATMGGGSVSAASAATDVLGHAQTTLTLGASGGTNVVAASVTGLSGSPVLFVATTQVSSTGAFAAKVDVATPQDPTSVVIGDINGDGLPDLVVGSESANGVSILLDTTAPGATTTSFAPRVDFEAGSSVEAVALGDFNGDGRLDVATANQSSGNVSVLLGTTATAATTPSFATHVDFLPSSSPTSIAIGDVNGDGKPDLVVTDSEGVSILLDTTAAGATEPSFAPRVDFPTGLDPHGVAIGDINGDGKLDLVVANAGNDANSVSILLNDAAVGATAPSFATKFDFPTGLVPFSVALGDLNSDGKLDLAVANHSGSANSVSVLLNTTAAGATTPSFAIKVDFAAGFGPHQVAIADLDGDGRLDLAVANNGNPAVSVLLDSAAPGATIAGFAAKLDYPTGTTDRSLAIADLDQDGKLDLAVVNWLDSTVSILLGL